MTTSPFRLDGQIALVTGASRGLGAAMAMALAEAGADVVLHASTAPPDGTAAEVHTRTGRRTHVLAADLRDAGAASQIAVDSTMAADVRLLAAATTLPAASGDASTREGTSSSITSLLIPASSNSNRRP